MQVLEEFETASYFKQTQELTSVVQLSFFIHFWDT